MNEQQQEVERRHYTRIGFQSPVTLVSGDSRFGTYLVDISLKGALIGHPSALKPCTGDKYHLVVELAEGAVQIEMEGTIAHVTAGTLGFHCRHIGLDSIGHLRRLIELNLGDSTLLERDLNELLGQE